MYVAQLKMSTWVKTAVLFKSQGFFMNEIFFVHFLLSTPHIALVCPLFCTMSTFIPMVRPKLLFSRSGAQYFVPQYTNLVFSFLCQLSVKTGIQKSNFITF